MPFYEYRCTKCDERFDLLRPLADRDLPATCPACGHSGAKRELARIQATGSRTGSSASATPPCGRSGFS